MEELVASVRRLHRAQHFTWITGLDLKNFRGELQYLDVPGLRTELTEAQEAYESELDVLTSLLVMHTPARRLRRGGISGDRSMGRQLQDVMRARAEKERAFQRWWAGSRRADVLRDSISEAERELAVLEERERSAMRDCHSPIVQLAQAWASCRPRERHPG